MGKLTDLIAGEQADAESAASAAAVGRSITGFSGRHTEMGDGPIAGAPVEPLRGPAAAAARSAAARTVRPKRVPFGGATLSLQVPQRPGYARYWFNDEPGRVGRARAAGYTHVLGQDGEPVSRVTGRNEGGIGRKSYLMEIPADWYEEDQAAQQADLEDKLAEIRHGRSGPGAADHRYVPQQGIVFKQGVGRRA